MISEIGWAALVSGVLAQSLKVLGTSLRESRFAWPRFFDTGGMPSSHAAVVSGLTTATGFLAGLQSSHFSISLIFSLYFIGEAGGLRQEVGRQARVLNTILEEHRTGHTDAPRKLKELVGHTWTEVGAGLALGFAVGAAFVWF